jgi:hypothetical protein
VGGPGAGRDAGKVTLVGGCQVLALVVGGHDGIDVCWPRFSVRVRVRVRV